MAKYAGSILMLSLHGYVGATPELGKPDTGGQVVFVLELAKRFSRLGYRVDVVTRRFENQPAVDRMTSGCRVWRIPFGGKKFIRKEDMHDHLGDFITNFLAEVKRKGVEYDVVNSHYWDAGWAGQRIAEEMSLSHVHTPHSLGIWKQRDMEGAPGEEKYRFDERIQKEFLVYRNCDHIIATTNQQVDLLREEYGMPENHLAMIPPGMDESRYTPVQPNRLKAIRKDLGITDKDVYTVGRIAHNKGIDLLIESLPHLRHMIPDARLILAVGANSEQDKKMIADLQKRAKELGLDNKKDIQWRGYVPDDQMANHYRAGAVFALPSRYEPFGMTAIEAMACGTPTVVTVHGGLYDAINFGTHALYADPKRPEEFGISLAMPILYPQLRDKLSIEGARFARRQFGWTGIAKRTLAVFDRFKNRYESPALSGPEDE